MKKYTILFIVFALFCAMFSAHAEVDIDNLPRIDEAAAKDYLGEWYMDSMCFENQCISLSGMGVTTVMEMKADNTVTMTGEDLGTESEDGFWYLEDGTAYFVNKLEDGTVSSVPLTFDEEGKLTVENDGALAKFSRNKTIEWGKGELVTDAKVEDFVGEWSLYSMGDDEMSLPVALLGMKGTLIVREDSTIELTFADETTSAAVEFKDGILSGLLHDEGTGKDDPFQIEYHAEGSLVLTAESDDTGKINMVFILPENMSTLDLSSLLSMEETTSPAE